MKKVVVVGASTGLGRCIGQHIARKGEHVALMARRLDKVQEAAEQAGNGAVAIQCDATDAASCTAAMDAAASAMGGIDAVIYAAAVGPIVRIEQATADQWRTTFDINVMGASFVTAAALPHLTASSGTVIYMSTTGASYTPSWAGLSIYQVTKAATEKLVEAWRTEHPAINFIRVAIGECTGGEGDNMTHFADNWDFEVAGQFAGSWVQRGYMNGGFIDVEHLAATFHHLVTMGESMHIPSMTIIPRPAVPHGV